MASRPSTASTRYTSVAIWLHWLIGLAIIANIAIAELTEDLARPERMEWMNLHKALGILVLLLSVARLVWRLGHTPPPLPASTPTWQAWASKATHVLLYVLMLGLPISGWIWMSVGPEPHLISMFGLFDWPALPVGNSEALGDAMHEAHEIMGEAMLILVGLHILAALKHQFIDRDNLIGRMRPH